MSCERFPLFHHFIIYRLLLFTFITFVSIILLTFSSIVARFMLNFCSIPPSIIIIRCSLKWKDPTQWQRHEIRIKSDGFRNIYDGILNENGGFCNEMMDFGFKMMNCTIKKRLPASPKDRLSQGKTSQSGFLVRKRRFYIGEW